MTACVCVYIYLFSILPYYRDMMKLDKALLSDFGIWGHSTRYSSWLLSKLRTFKLSREIEENDLLYNGYDLSGQNFCVLTGEWQFKKPKLKADFVARKYEENPMWDKDMWIKRGQYEYNEGLWPSDVVNVCKQYGAIPAPHATQLIAFKQELEYGKEAEWPWDFGQHWMNMFLVPDSIESAMKYINPKAKYVRCAWSHRQFDNNKKQKPNDDDNNNNDDKDEREEKMITTDYSISGMTAAVTTSKRSQTPEPPNISNVVPPVPIMLPKMSNVASPLKQPSPMQKPKSVTNALTDSLRELADELNADKMDQLLHLLNSKSITTTPITRESLKKSKYTPSMCSTFASGSAMSMSPTTPEMSTSTMSNLLPPTTRSVTPAISAATILSNTSASTTVAQSIPNLKEEIAVRKMSLLGSTAEPDPMSFKFYRDMLNANNIKRTRLFNNVQLHALKHQEDRNVNKAFDMVAARLIKMDINKRKDSDDDACSVGIYDEFDSDSDTDENVLNMVVDYLDFTSFPAQEWSVLKRKEPISLWAGNIRNTSIQFDKNNDLWIGDCWMFIGSQPPRFYYVQDVDILNNRMLCDDPAVGFSQEFNLNDLHQKRDKFILNERRVIGSKASEVLLGSVLYDEWTEFLYRLVSKGSQVYKLLVMNKENQITGYEDKQIDNIGYMQLVWQPSLKSTSNTINFADRQYRVPRLNFWQILCFGWHVLVEDLIASANGTMYKVIKYNAVSDCWTLLNVNDDEQMTIRDYRVFKTYVFYMDDLTETVVNAMDVRSKLKQKIDSKEKDESRMSVVTPVRSKIVVPKKPTPPPQSTTQWLFDKYIDKGIRYDETRLVHYGLISNRQEYEYSLCSGDYSKVLPRSQGRVVIEKASPQRDLLAQHISPTWGLEKIVCMKTCEKWMESALDASRMWTKLDIINLKFKIYKQNEDKNYSIYDIVNKLKPRYQFYREQQLDLVCKRFLNGQEYHEKVDGINHLYDTLVLHASLFMNFSNVFCHRLLSILMESDGVVNDKIVRRECFFGDNGYEMFEGFDCDALTAVYQSKDYTALGGPFAHTFWDLIKSCYLNPRITVEFSMKKMFTDEQAVMLGNFVIAQSVYHMAA